MNVAKDNSTGNSTGFTQTWHATSLHLSGNVTVFTHAWRAQNSSGNGTD
ncbi:MAG: hypothetical protein HDS16_05930 [Bacteroides sp.]|nr:hypothetical protein [Bacteroides sp.]